MALEGSDGGGGGGSVSTMHKTTKVKERNTFLCLPSFVEDLRFYYQLRYTTTSVIPLW